MFDENTDYRTSGPVTTSLSRVTRITRDGTISGDGAEVVHELSIALSIVDGVTEEARSRGVTRVSAVHLRLGTFSGVVPDALQFAWDEACRGTLLEKSTLEIESVPLLAHCPSCSENRELPDRYSFFCSVCTTPVDVVSGRELEITAMEVEP